MTDIQPGTILRQRYTVIRSLGAGGQGQTFEVEEAGKLKVLKVLMLVSPQTIAYFQKEAEILSRLDHPGIPGIDPEDGYFTEAISGQAEPLHCLVMAKIEGINLHAWMNREHNQPVTQGQAIDWLAQLVKILHEIHHNDFFHLDIKPGNIMLQPDKTLALVDFGIAKEVTNTYLVKLASGADITSCGTFSYTAPEVFAGKAVPQSDFFSLGRTFVFLLTGQPLETLPRNEKNGLVWRTLAPQVSSTFADLLDRLMADKPSQRFFYAQELLDYLANHFTFRSADPDRSSEVVAERQSKTVNDLTQRWEPERQQQTHPSQPTNTQQSEAKRSHAWFHLPSRREIGVALLASMVCAIATAGIRYTGLLEPWELQTFDQMMQLRKPEIRDSRILVIEVKDEDIEAHKNEPGQGSLKDPQLTDLLKKLKQAQALVIGLDIYRPDPIKNNPQLQQQLQTAKNLYGVCKVKDDASDSPGIKQPPDLKAFGFSDFVDQPGTNLHRHLLSMDLNPKSCAASYAFSFLLALKYLNNKKEIKLDQTKKKNWKIGSTVLKRLNPHTGFYHRDDSQLNEGYQILFNNRNRPSNEIAERLKLTDFLKGDFRPEAIKDRIVLIGVAADYTNDKWSILGQPDVWGVWVQANMTSQLISAVLDGRPLLEFWEPWLDAAWILGWGIVGSIFAVWLRSRPLLIIADAIALLILIGTGIFWLSCGTIVPIMPPALVLILTGEIILAYVNAQNKKQLRKF